AIRVSYEGRAFVLPLLPSEYRKSAELNIGPAGFIQQEKEPGRAVRLDHSRPSWSLPLPESQPAKLQNNTISVGNCAVRIAVRICYSFDCFSTTYMPPTPCKSL